MLSPAAMMPVMSQCPKSTLNPTRTAWCLYTSSSQGVEGPRCRWVLQHCPSHATAASPATSLQQQPPLTCVAPCAKLSPRKRASTQSCFPQGHHLQLPHPCHIPEPKGGGSATIRPHCLPTSDKNSHSQAPSRGLAPAPCPGGGSSHLPLYPTWSAPPCTPLGANARDWDPRTKGHLATARRGGESLSAGWRPPLTAC